MTQTLSKTKELRPIYWDEKTETVFVLDQKALPYEFKYIEIKTHREMAEAIKDMTLRGAPLIGIAAAYGMALAAKDLRKEEISSLVSNAELLSEADELLRDTRPTAVNLSWALNIIKDSFNILDFDCGDPLERQHLYEAILNEAKFIHEDDISRCKAMATQGAGFIKHVFFNPMVGEQKTACKKVAAYKTVQNFKKSGKRKLRCLTHCNAGALATGGHGTALGVIRDLHAEGLIEMVYSDETRPRQQGSRLTTFELAYENIPVTMNTDNMAAYLMQQGLIDFVITGADRITSNGDAANKIGTYQLAIAAHHHQVPFFIAAPLSTVDRSLTSGKEIPIEERNYTEVSHINGQSCAASTEFSVIKNHAEDGKDYQLGQVQYVNPGFDVTPNELIDAIFTEVGLFKPDL